MQHTLTFFNFVCILQKQAECNIHNFFFNKPFVLSIVSCRRMSNIEQVIILVDMFPLQKLLQRHSYYFQPGLFFGLFLKWLVHHWVDLLSYSLVLTKFFECWTPSSRITIDTNNLYDTEFFDFHIIYHCAIELEIDCGVAVMAFYLMGLQNLILTYISPINNVCP